MKNSKRLLPLLIAILFVVLRSSAGLADYDVVVDEKRNKLIGYMLSKQLPSIHYSDKRVNDELAAAIFDLYLKQLDFQKRFLTRADAEHLQRFADTIDDNLMRGTIALPKAGYDIMSQRIDQVEDMVTAILDNGIDRHGRETMETDPEKLAFVDDIDGLEQRWRKILKAQVMTRYLDLEEEYQADGKEFDPDQLWEEATERVKKRFDDFFHRLHREDLQDHYDRYFNAVARAFDPHTNYMAPDRKEDFDIHMRGSLEGIGALLREESGYIKVVRIIPGSASAKQGRLQAEDIILAVAEKGEEAVEISDMRLRDAVKHIRGPKGTDVVLTVRKPDGTKDIITITRDVVQIEETFVKYTVLESDENRFGYINIPSFYRDFEQSRFGGGRNSTDDTRNAINELQREGIGGLILDLRNDGGGSLVDAVDITGLFIDSGPVVQVKNSQGQKRVLEDEDDTVLYGGPLVVLVNKFSASAAEIVAAALQDYRRAVIVGGKHTHGKGTVQTIIDLNENIPLLHLRRYEDLGALKATIQKFYRIDGGSTQYRGVEPDIILPSLFQNLESGEQYLDYSLEWDQDDPARFTRYSDKIPDLSAIREKSKARTAESAGLQAIRMEAERSALRSEQTVIELDLDTMRAKREEERLAREKIEDHYSAYGYLEEDDEGEPETIPESVSIPDEQDDEDWIAGLEKDPYIIESQMIINDLTFQLNP